MAESWITPARPHPAAPARIRAEICPAQERYRLGDLIVDACAGEVRRGGQPLSMSPLSFDLLLALVRRAPEVVRRHELLSTVWPDEFVNDDTLSQRVRLLREALDDIAVHPRYVASVRGWGYRILAAVERLAPDEAPIRSVAVLPLANLGGDPQQDYFADAMTETLISTLASIGEVRTISRTSIIHYKHTDHSLPQIASELGADAVVEGGIFVAGSRVRVSVQLIRAVTDEHLWAKSYDRRIEDVLALHAELAKVIAGEIRAVLAHGGIRTSPATAASSPNRP